jgi:hypothetical protein
MFLSRHQNAGQNHYIIIENRAFENVSQFRYLGMTVTNQNLIQEEIKRWLNSYNACYHSVQKLLSSHLLSENLECRIYETIVLSMILYSCETRSLSLREEHRLRVSENRVLRIFLPKKEEVTGGWRKLHNVELCGLYSSKSRRMRWMGHVAWRGERGMLIGYQWESQRARDH